MIQYKSTIVTNIDIDLLINNTIKDDNYSLFSITPLNQSHLDQMQQIYKFLVMFKIKSNE